ncbi:hypothetical protein GY45DRAFT_133960 [Cubamyces sp. BRFM 1775]|nr:hypothetical protein GY45DRAFT_133960 [Cubamyces sp. BRFM 1775]
MYRGLVEARGPSNARSPPNAYWPSNAYSPPNTHFAKIASTTRRRVVDDQYEGPSDPLHPLISQSRLWTQYIRLSHQHGTGVSRLMQRRPRRLPNVHREAVKTIVAHGRCPSTLLHPRCPKHLDATPCESRASFRHVISRNQHLDKLPFQSPRIASHAITTHTHTHTHTHTLVAWRQCAVESDLDSRPSGLSLIGALRVRVSAPAA